MSGADDLSDCIIYRCVVGSRAYGLSHDGSDTDRRGIYVPPAELHWSMTDVPGQLENRETDDCYWEIEKFLRLALKGNPTILECLYSPIVELATPLAEELRDMRSAFISKRVYLAYTGYASDQFARQEKQLQLKGAIKWKSAMHLVRLLLSGITVLREGVVPVRVDEHREQLLAIRRGGMSWEEIDAWRQELMKEAEAAFEVTRLPEHPDLERVNAFLIKARRSMV